MILFSISLFPKPRLHLRIVQLACLHHFWQARKYFGFCFPFYVFPKQRLHLIDSLANDCNLKSAIVCTA